ncbi:MAG TPA: hypothetical protein VFE05_14145 [Longimicrobiaceae bacterium]|jgi:hypothetical protein|nr:hypothetical protein [Longimicrobiaceae bacterium]
MTPEREIPTCQGLTWSVAPAGAEAWEEACAYRANSIFAWLALVMLVGINVYLGHPHHELVGGGDYQMVLPAIPPMLAYGVNAVLLATVGWFLVRGTLAMHRDPLRWRMTIAQVGVALLVYSGSVIYLSTAAALFGGPTNP